MSDPVIANKMPAVLDLEAGKTYAWCACGRSGSQPFCDGSHKGTGFSPIVFQAEETKRYAMCQCKRSKNKPFCDGTHSSL